MEDLQPAFPLVPGGGVGVSLYGEIQVNTFEHVRGSLYGERGVRAGNGEWGQVDKFEQVHMKPCFTIQFVTL